MLILPKYEEYQIAHGLTNGEYACRCNFDECIATIVSPKLIKSYEEFRRMIDMPILPTSGYRCQRHNFENVYDSNPDQVTLSRHLTGEAIDFYIKSILDRYNLDAILTMLGDVGFTFTKHYPDASIIHADVR